MRKFKLILFHSIKTFNRTIYLRGRYTPLTCGSPRMVFVFRRLHRILAAIVTKLISSEAHSSMHCLTPTEIWRPCLIKKNFKKHSHFTCNAVFTILFKLSQSQREIAEVGEPCTGRSRCPPSSWCDPRRRWARHDPVLAAYLKDWLPCSFPYTSHLRHTYFLKILLCGRIIYLKTSSRAELKAQLNIRPH